MIAPEKYWAYKQEPIPEMKDLPSGVFNGDEHGWNSLSPGMRRTIWREAMKRLAPPISEPSVDDDRINRADAVQRKSEVQIEAL